jgi:hypothetical protein
VFTCALHCSITITGHRAHKKLEDAMSSYPAETENARLSLEDRDRLISRFFETFLTALGGPTWAAYIITVLMLTALIAGTVNYWYLNVL